MFRIYPPGVTLIALLVAGVLTLFRSKRKTRRPASDYAPSPYLDRVKDVVDSHSDCTAEVFNIFVSGADKVRIFSELIPGDRVELRLRDDEVSVYVKGIFMSATILSDSSSLCKLLQSGEDVEAFLGGRDVAYCTDNAEFCSIIAFYKIEGIAPTHVILK